MNGKEGRNEERIQIRCNCNCCSTLARALFVNESTTTTKNLSCHSAFVYPVVGSLYLDKTKEKEEERERGGVEVRVK